MSDTGSDESFELPIVYKGKDILLTSRLVRWGYSYRIVVDASGQEIIFELDEERNFRAIIENDLGKNVPLDMMQAIGQALEKHLR